MDDLVSIKRLPNRIRTPCAHPVSPSRSSSIASCTRSEASDRIEARPSAALKDHINLNRRVPPTIKNFASGNVDNSTHELTALCLGSVYTMAHRQGKGDVGKGEPDVSSYLISLIANLLVVRLQPTGIDAPELDQPWGQKSKWAMVKICKGQIITAKLNGERSHDRLVATCYRSDGSDIGAEIIKQGLALDWTKFSAGKYRHLEPKGVRNKLRQAHHR